MFTRANAEAEKIDPDHPFEVVITGMAGVYMMLGDNDAALKSAIKAAQMFPRGDLFGSGPCVHVQRGRRKGA